MFNVTGKATVFEVKDEDKVVKVNLSTSKKQADDSFVNMYWKGVFVGKAKEKAKELKDKDKIEIVNGAVENKYDKETKKTWVSIVIFDFKKCE